MHRDFRQCGSFFLDSFHGIKLVMRIQTRTCLKDNFAKDFSDLASSTRKATCNLDCVVNIQNNGFILFLFFKYEIQSLHNCCSLYNCLNEIRVSMALIW